MIIQYDKKTGDVEATYQEGYGDPPEIKVEESKDEGLFIGEEEAEKKKTKAKKKNHGTVYLMPLEAVEFGDMTKKNIHDYKVVTKGNKPVEIQKKKGTGKKFRVVEKKNLKAEMDKWAKEYPERRKATIIEKDKLRKARTNE